MTTWKLSIKLGNKEDRNNNIAFKLCKEKSILAVGWSAAYSENQPSNMEDARIKVKSRFDDEWPKPLETLLEIMQPGDHVWLHQAGKYFLCKAADQLYFGKEIDANFLEYDLGHARKAEWVEIPEKYVSGSVQRGTIAQRMIQRIRLSEKEEQYHEYLFRKLSSDPKWVPTIDNLVLEEKLSESDMDEVFGIMSPDDVEDIVATHLQSQGWNLIKSTCFRSKPVFEFSMQNKKGRFCSVQVKSGKSPNALSPKEYEVHVIDNGIIYLFSTNENPYPGEPARGVIPIQKQELFNYLKENTWALTTSLKLRLWIYLCENIVKGSENYCSTNKECVMKVC